MSPLSSTISQTDATNDPTRPPFPIFFFFVSNVSNFNCEFGETYLGDLSYQHELESFVYADSHVEVFVPSGFIPLYHRCFEDLVLVIVNRNLDVGCGCVENLSKGIQQRPLLNYRMAIWGISGELGERLIQTCDFTCNPDFRSNAARGSFE